MDPVDRAGPLRRHTALAVRPLDAAGRGPDWLRLVGGLRRRPGFFWLDSSRPDPRLGRHSFAGAEPWAWLRVEAGRVEVDVRRAVDPAWPVGRHRVPGAPLDALRRLLPPAPEAPVPPDAPPFCAGAVAAFGYELADAWEALPSPREAGPGVPELHALAVDGLYACDHLEGRIVACALGMGATPAAARRRAEARVTELAARLPRGDPPPAPGGPARRTASPTLAPDQAQHAKDVARILERIVAGDVYQACLTHRLELPFAGDPWALHGALRARSPAPFSAFLALGDLTVVGSSPERFLSVSPGGWVESRPIKGTRPRGADSAADRALRAELSASAKDRAENLMIVDLVRHDLGRVCETGSVHVPELLAVESHANLFQMVSTVRGRLREGCDALDAVRAAFPPGSMTGAPKLAAMRLLRALEPEPRGLYAGALGWLDSRGGCDLSVVIRTAFLRRGRAWLHTGGGIVADSKAGAEWREAADKARPLLRALAEAEL